MTADQACRIFWQVVSRGSVIFALVFPFVNREISRGGPVGTTVVGAVTTRDMVALERKAHQAFLRVRFAKRRADAHPRQELWRKRQHDFAAQSSMMARDTA
jgi:hypothetical protein